MGYLLVMAGGAIGSGLRYGVGRMALTWFGTGFPWGTLAVNLLGGFGMGLLVSVLARLDQDGEPWRLLIGIGVLGGFTTFSSFSLDLANMIQRGEAMVAVGYALMSVIGALLALVAGLAISRAAA